MKSLNVGIGIILENRKYESNNLFKKCYISSN
jgi:hypothetical protein